MYNILEDKKFFELGYAVIENWLSEKEIEILLSEYNTLRQGRDENKDNVFFMTDQILCLIKNKIRNILTMINDKEIEDHLNIDMITPYMLFTNTETVNFPWHQDHESYWIFQQHKNYLNFYMILEKEDSYKSGLSLIPLNVVKEKFPKNIIEKIVNSGAKEFVVDQGRTIVYDQQVGEEYLLNFNIDDLSFTPKLNRGDLLLMRGDTIHKTQDDETHRIAASIRCTDSTSKITLEHLMQTCVVKSSEMSKRIEEYSKLFDIVNSKTEVTAKDYINESKYIL